LIAWWVGGAVEEGGFEQGDAVETPRGVGELPGELGFRSGGGLVFVEELAVSGAGIRRVLGSEDGGLAGQAVGDGVLRRTLFAGGSAGPGGERRIRTVRANALLRGWGLGIGVGIGFVMDDLGCSFSTGVWRFHARTGGCCWVGGGDGWGRGVNGRREREGGQVAGGLGAGLFNVLARIRPWRCRQGN